MTLQVRRDTGANRVTIQPLAGEPIFETDRADGYARLYMGNADSMGGRPVGIPYAHIQGATQQELWTSPGIQAVLLAQAGFSIPPLATPVSHPVAVGVVPAFGLADGGWIDLTAVGTFTPGSTDPRLTFDLRFSATVGGGATGKQVRSSGAAGASGIDVHQGTIGDALLSRVAADSIVELVVRIHSLGENAAVPGSYDAGGDANLFFHGQVIVRELQDGSADRGLTYDYSTAYTLGDVIWVHERPYRAVHSFTSAASGIDEIPGLGADWRDFWQPFTIEYDVNGVLPIDVTVNNDLFFGASGPKRDDLIATGTATAWASAQAYVFGDVRSANGSNWSCVLAHTSAAANEPGGGDDEYNAYWIAIGTISPPDPPNEGFDAFTILSTSAFLVGGRTGHKVPHL